LLLAGYYNFRRNVIVPNVSWGLLDHEADILVCSKQFYVTEIEIKISKSDLLADRNKRHGHVDRQNRIKYLYFAVPEKLLPFTEFLDESVGIFVVKEYVSGGFYIELHRKAKAKNKARPLDYYEYLQLCRLGVMRVWGLKRKIKFMEKLNSE